MPITKKRKFSNQFKADAVQLVLDKDYTPKEAAESLDISANMLCRWIREAQARESEGEQTPGDTLSESEREELLRLRQENKRLAVERDILKKATAFFANESS